MTGSEVPAVADVVVVGGGAIGAWAAYTLMRAGRQVVLLERDDTFGARASRGNAGLITTSSAMPIASPGVIRDGIRMAADPDSPFRFRPTLSAEFVRWFAGFRRGCRPEAVHRVTARSIELVRASRSILDALPAPLRDGFGYTTAGVTALYGSEDTLAAGVAKARHLGEDFGVPWRAVPIGEVAAPGRLRAVGAGGVHYPQDAHVDPERMVHELVAHAVNGGATALAGVEVRGLAERAAGISVHTSAGPIRATSVVVAAGAWAARVLGGSGRLVPMQPGQGYSIDLATPSHAGSGLGPPIRLADVRMMATPLSGRLRLTGKLDLRGLSAPPDVRRARRMLALAEPYLPGLGRLQPAREVWSGHRPLSPDGLPIIGPLPGRSGVIVAAGHGHLGVSLAPVTGSIVAALLGSGDLLVEVEDLRVGRFG